MEMRFTNLAFYAFVELAPLEELRERLLELGEAYGVRGTVILGGEGINGMLAAPSERVDAFVEELRAVRPALEGVHIKRSVSEEMPFGRLSVKIKSEIVTMRVDGVEPGSRTGEHLEPERLRDWLRGDEEMVLVDVRNHFECELGTFRGAIDPMTTAFHEFPDVVRARREEWEDKKIVMFCTGGIRCEKATSWMLDEGFEQVYQLEGGVLNYFEKIEDAQRDWSGELFVFDGRVALDTNLAETGTTLEDLEE